MPEFKKLPKLRKGDRVAILSPSFAAPGRWPEVYELGLKRLKEVFGLEPVEFPTTKQIGASAEDRTHDLIAAFEDESIKAVITSLGGDDQITYAKNLPREPFANNSKPFFGYSDNTHIENHLWLCGVPSYYGGALFTQFAMQGQMDDFTVEYLRHALFDEGEFELKASDQYNDIGLNWNEPANLTKRREYEPNAGWQWDGTANVEGITWGGCVESIDEILRHGTPMPALEDFKDIILFAETSEEMPSADYVRRVYRALGERGILQRVRGVLVGRAKAWEYDKPLTTEQKQEYREAQAQAILETVRHYNQTVPIVQNIDFGHTDPQICLPNGAPIRLDSSAKKIYAHS
jgi:muramoyltetrapeptide carboxypeptidase LdcA involved in peptidoglycan recycling